MNAFSSLVRELTVHNETPTNSEKKTVTKKEYQIFCKEYIFKQLEGESFAYAFCKRFGIRDTLLSSIMGYENAKFLIETIGYIK